VTNYISYVPLKIINNFFIISQVCACTFVACIPTPSLVCLYWAEASKAWINKCNYRNLVVLHDPLKIFYCSNAWIFTDNQNNSHGEVLEVHTLLQPFPKLVIRVQSTHVYCRHFYSHHWSAEMFFFCLEEKISTFTVFQDSP